MATTETFLINTTTRHAIYVDRFSGSQLKKMLPYLQQVRRQTAGLLADDELTEFGERRLKRLYNEITGVTVEVLGKMGKKLKGDMKEFAAYEKGFQERTLNKATNVEWDVPSKAQITAAVFSEPIDMLAEKGMSVDDILDEFGKKKAQQMVRVVQGGVISGRTNGQIVKDMGLLTNKVIGDGVNALVRSITNHVSSVARNMFYRDNDDIVKKYRWLSTLDSSTCETCMALDGQEFDVGDGPMPPAHWGCRCTTIPIVDDKYSIRGLVDTERPSIGEDGAELVSSKITYGEWLKEQPASFQDDVLGKTKGELFREGGLTVDKFVDNNYQPITLKELEESDSKAIQQAFSKIKKDDKNE